MDEKALGRRLQLARKRAGLTQQELCQKAGMSYSTLAKIERGAIRSPSVFTVAAIAQATATNLEELLELEARGLAPPAPSKRRSKSGVSFVYFDVNGVLVRFFEKAFTAVAKKSGKPIEAIETFYWRHDEKVSTGQMKISEFNKVLGKELGLDNFDWQKYYMEAIEPVPGSKELLKWASENYEVGILTNNFPGFVVEAREKKIIPDIEYKAIVESAKAGITKPDPKIYKMALEMADVQPSEILLVDDTQPNLAAADRAGWQVLWFNHYEPDKSIARVKSALEF